jgi:hypothetical protein
VRVRLAAADQEWCYATVVLASAGNPSSVLLMVDSGGLVPKSSGGFLNALPLSVDYDSETVRSLFGDDYEIEV